MFYLFVIVQKYVTVCSQCDVNMHITKGDQISFICSGCSSANFDKEIETWAQSIMSVEADADQFTPSPEAQVENNLDYPLFKALDFEDISADFLNDLITLGC